jgi:p21-activated kinase 1
VNNMLLGSPRTIKISLPGNPIHLTHVGYDNETGQFTVRISLFHGARLHGR